MTFLEILGLIAVGCLIVALILGIMLTVYFRRERKEMQKTYSGAKKRKSHDIS